MDTLDKPITARKTSNLWYTTPAMIEWMQRQRKPVQPTDTVFRALHNGINSTIVLLSATCIEGFLRECLQSFENTLSSKDTFDKRLKHNYYERVSNATFGEMSKLFCLALGKPLSEIFKGQTILEQVAILFKFRNGIAHGRSLEYRSYSAYASEPSTWEFEAWGQYESVEEYLIKNKFISKTDEDVFSNEIADHFAGLIEPYIRCIVSVLPEEQSKSLRFRLRVAFSDKPSGNGKVLAGNQVSAITCITPSAPSGAESL